MPLVDTSNTYVFFDALYYLLANFCLLCSTDLQSIWPKIREGHVCYPSPRLRSPSSPICKHLKYNFFRFLVNDLLLHMHSWNFHCATVMACPVLTAISIECKLKFVVLARLLKPKLYIFPSTLVGLYRHN